MLMSAPLSALRVRGTTLVDTSGRTVQLRGVNLGGWLVEEIWMTPWVNKESADKPETVRDHVSLWKTVEDRIGHDAMIRVREAYRQNWINDDDFARIRAAGFNHVRLPFLVDLLDEPNGVQWLHRAVEMAKKHDLYVVLDMHGVPGRQSNDHHTGQENQNGLWSSPGNIAQYVDAWTRLAKEFGSEPSVAMFDLMNEPMGAPNTATLFLIYDQVIRAVRRLAPYKVLALEDGYKGFDNCPAPSVFGWTDVVYSLHFYQWDAKKPQDHVDILRKDMDGKLPVQKKVGTPVYAGEFNLEPFNGPDAMHQVVKMYDDAGWSWALWTWKVMPTGGDSLGNWGLNHPSGPVTGLDPFHDSEVLLLRKMLSIRTERLTQSPGMLAAFRG